MEASSINLSLMQHMQDTSKSTNLNEWMLKYANALTTSALARVGLLKAYNSCEPNKILSIKTEDKDMFGISHKLNVVTVQQTEMFLQSIDNMYDGNCVEQLHTAIKNRKNDERIVVNVMCGLDKLTDGKIKSKANCFVFIKAFTIGDTLSGHNGCSCC